MPARIAKVIAVTVSARQHALNSRDELFVVFVMLALPLG